MTSIIKAINSLPEFQRIWGVSSLLKLFYEKPCKLFVIPYELHSDCIVTCFMFAKYTFAFCKLTMDAYNHPEEYLTAC